nr:MAG TPA: hypothetical protein [Caudoviricetes sp.]
MERESGVTLRLRHNNRLCCEAPCENIPRKIYCTSL